MAPSWMKDILITRANNTSSVYLDNKSAPSQTTISSSSTVAFQQQQQQRKPVPQLDMAFTPQPLERCVSAFDPPSPTSKNFESSFSRTMKYGLWPKMKRQFTLPKTPSQEVITPVINRSPSSLSESAVTPLAMHSSNYRGATLSQRRKVSVPELRRKPAPENFKTAPALVESPTLGGFPEISYTAPPASRMARPKLRTVASDIGTHSRSISCPDDAVRRAITEEDIFKPQPQSQSQPRSSSLRQPNWLAPVPGSEWMTFNPTRPLSPIFSPLEATTPTSVVAPSDYVEATPATPPSQVVAKAESIVNITPTPMNLPARKPVRTSPTSSPIAHPLQSGPRISPTRNSDREKLSPTRRPTSPKLSICIPKSIPEEQHFPVQQSTSYASPTSAKTYTAPASILDRGRPVARSKSSKSLREDQNDYATLPTGLLPADATIVMPLTERETLRKQASSQAERFEILGTEHVSSLSKELRALDERCDYLRKTYKSLRAGRQKLHSRVLNYLKSEASFSKDRLLKQEEALVELDRAIDDWAFKLERAENRRLRVRQKLLEHVAASMMLNLSGGTAGAVAGVDALSNTGYSTPPHSSGGHGPATPEPLRVDRKDIESIKIYADTQVLSLFSDIELAIGRMCETAC